MSITVILAPLRIGRYRHFLRIGCTR